MESFVVVDSAQRMLRVFFMVVAVVMTSMTTTNDNGNNNNSAVFFVNGQTSLYRGLAGTKRRRSGIGNNSVAGNDGLIDDIPTVTLSNGVELPLVGLGVGNLNYDLIETMIYEGLKSSNRLRLIDTAHASRNEKEVARGIVTGVQRFHESLQEQPKPKQIQVHVITKIWYTYLGYERTKIAVDEIMSELNEALNHPLVDLKIHLLLHWPQCYDHISWMDCEMEEHNLPYHVKSAGPPPHLDRPNAWKESWRALEDIYDQKLSTPKATYKSISSIGISNFEPHHLKYLVESASIQPHISQMNAWNIVNNHQLVEFHRQHNIHVQLYNVMNGFTNKIEAFPHAYHHLLMIASQLESSRIDVDENSVGNLSTDIVPSQVILKYCLQKGYSTITRTSKLERLASNSAVSIGQRIQPLTDEQSDVTYQAMTAIMNQRDMTDDVHVKVKFHAKESDIFVYWLSSGDGGAPVEEQHVAFIENGSSVEQRTYPDHKFKVYHAYDPSKYQTYEVTKSYGETQDIHVEL